MFYKDMGQLEDALEELGLPSNLNSRDVTAMYMGCQYVTNLLEEHGLQFRGYSFKPRVPLALLVVKATKEDVPVVCFVSERTLCSCFYVFFRLLDVDAVQWVPDRFA